MIETLLLGRWRGIAKGLLYLLAAIAASLLATAVLQSDGINTIYYGLVVGMALFMAATFYTLPSEKNSEGPFHLLFYGIHNALAWFLSVLLLVAGFAYHLDMENFFIIGFVFGAITMLGSILYTVGEDKFQDKHPNQ